MTKHNKVKKLSGMYLPVILISCTVFMAFAVAIVTIAMSSLRISNLHKNQITSMSVAEAGINYYLWHLSHNNTDYCDGNTCTGSPPYGPFTHSYSNISGEVLGSYDLYITPPSVGSSITTVKSVGKVSGSKVERTILSQIGMPSFTKYGVLINGNQLVVGADAKINGTVFVNNSGVYNLGEITGDAYSTEDTYNSAGYGVQPGVSGPGIFGGGKFFPVPSIDFNQLSVDIARIRNDVKALGLGDYYDASTSRGYHIILNSNNYEIRRVTKYDVDNNIVQEDSSSIHNYPADGVIFLEDNVWLEGTVDNQKVTVIAADPEANHGNKKRIVINGSIKYTNYDGRDKVGLITQTEIVLAKNIPTNAEIDAAMIAKEGNIFIPNYNTVKNYLKIYGSIACQSSFFKYTDNGGVVTGGFNSRDLIIDQNNVLNPPPRFPLTGTFAILSWREE